jgi:hypothetical protein
LTARGSGVFQRVQTEFVPSSGHAQAAPKTQRQNTTKSHLIRFGPKPDLRARPVFNRPFEVSWPGLAHQSRNRRYDQYDNGMSALNPPQSSIRALYAFPKQRKINRLTSCVTKYEYTVEKPLNREPPIEELLSRYVPLFPCHFLYNLLRRGRLDHEEVGINTQLKSC